MGVELAADVGNNIDRRSILSFHLLMKILKLFSFLKEPEIEVSTLVFVQQGGV